MLHSGAAAVALWGAAVVQLYLGGADLGSGRGGFIAVLSWMKIGLLEVDAVLACFVDCSVICALSVLSNEMYANLCLSAWERGAMAVCAPSSPQGSGFRAEGAPPATSRVQSTHRASPSPASSHFPRTVSH